MAAYRKISITFWADSFVQGLTPEGKYFYLYLMTNTRTTQCGIYEITMGQMCFETGYNQETVLKLIALFEKSGKIKYSKSTNEIALKNWPRYNESTSPKVVACVNNELKSIKNKVLIEYLYSIDTKSQETKAKAEPEEEPKSKGKKDEPDLEQFENWTREIISGQDFIFHQKFQNEFPNWGGSPEKFVELLKGHLDLLHRYPKMNPNSQQRFRASVIKHIKEELIKQTNGTGKRKGIDTEEALRNIYGNQPVS